MARSIILLLLLSGCMTNNWKEDEHKDSVTIKWVRVDDVNKTCRSLTRVGHNKPILGCAHPYKDKCTVYTPELGEVDGKETTTLGHEVAHCFDYGYKE